MQKKLLGVLFVDRGSMGRTPLVRAESNGRFKVACELCGVVVVSASELARHKCVQPVGVYG